MNVFSDRHHRDLYHSLELLFKRLGWNLYCQTGLEWYKEGYWNIYPHIDTAKQYLEREDQGKGITLEQFREMKIDIVVASIPAHIEPFKRLAQMKGAKFVFQMGNMFTEVLNNLHEIPNLMASTVPVDHPHAVFYHQEFDTELFKPSTLPSSRQIVSFINVYQDNVGFEDYAMLKSMMPDYDFRSYGGQCIDGTVGTTQEIATIMQDSYFGFHSKRMGDGYGHVLYNWYACGKPVITRISDYEGKLGEELLEDEETCLDLDKHNYNEIQYIVSSLPPEKYAYMSQKAYQRFLDKVDFNAEEQLLKNFLDNLK